MGGGERQRVEKWVEKGREYTIILLSDYRTDRQVDRCTGSELQIREKSGTARHRYHITCQFNHKDCYSSHLYLCIGAAVRDLLRFDRFPLIILILLLLLLIKVRTVMRLWISVIQAKSQPTMKATKRQEIETVAVSQRAVVTQIG